MTYIRDYTCVCIYIYMVDIPIVKVSYPRTNRKSSRRLRAAQGGSRTHAEIDSGIASGSQCLGNRCKLILILIYDIELYWHLWIFILTLILIWILIFICWYHSIGHINEYHEIGHWMILTFLISKTLQGWRVSSHIVCYRHAPFFKRCNIFRDLSRICPEFWKHIPRWSVPNARTFPFVFNRAVPCFPVWQTNRPRYFHAVARHP